MQYRRELVSAMAAGQDHPHGSQIRHRTGGLGHQPADGRRRLGGDARGHHRAARRRARTRLDAGAAAADAPRSSRRSRPSASASRIICSTVADGAMAMRSTATTLLASSGQTSQRAEGAVSTSNEASSNVETAAVAADELSGSIEEISRQLAQTTDDRARGGRGSARHQCSRSPRCRRPRRRSATWSS